MCFFFSFLTFWHWLSSLNMIPSSSIQVTGTFVIAEQYSLVVAWFD